MIRSFLAISLPDVIADSLVDLQDGVRNARWIDEDSFHITLVFLGTCSPHELTELDAGLSGLRHERFTLAPYGVGSFGGAVPRQLYAGFAESEPLRRLQKKLERVVRDTGLDINRRKYTPHVTLARCGGGVIPAQAIDWTLRHARLSLSPFEAVEFGLYRSDLGTGVPIYTQMAKYDLAEPSE